MQIVACQFDIAWEDKRANFARVRELLGAGHIEPGALIVLPEMFATGFSMHVDKIAEPPDGDTRKFLAELAIASGAWIVGGAVTRTDDGRALNEALVIGPNGQLVVRYAKLHPFSFGGEARYFAAGRQIATFDWQSSGVAPFVCYDLRFPEVFRLAVRKGVQVFLVIANWPEPRDGHWQTLLRARAIENQAFVVGVNRVGKDPKLAYVGHSVIVGFQGETLAAADTSECVIDADLDLAKLLKYRADFPALADMREEFLGG
jgi:omega-amidase